MRTGRLLLMSTAVLAVFGGMARAEDTPLPLIGSTVLMPNGPNYLDLALGGYALYYSHHEVNQDFAGSFTLRLGEKWNYIGPAVGAVANTDGGAFVFAGGYGDIKWGQLTITPLIGVGADHHGDRHDEYLGGVFQFRLQLTASYEFDNQYRLGVQLGHISSAHINKVNPGENEVMASFGIPFQW